MNKELELYKLIMTPDSDDLDISYVDEFGWEHDGSFGVWVSKIWWDEFINGLSMIFGASLFDEGGFDAKIQEDCIYIDLAEILSGYSVNLENIFQKDKYKH